jgi:hypothetical protein
MSKEIRRSYDAQFREGTVRTLSGGNTEREHRDVARPGTATLPAGTGMGATVAPRSHDRRPR